MLFVSQPGAFKMLAERWMFKNLIIFY